MTNANQAAEAAAVIVETFGLRRAKRCWRGNCPKCGVVDSLALSFPKPGQFAAHAFCRNCQESAAISLDKTI